MKNIRLLKSTVAIAFSVIAPLCASAGDGKPATKVIWTEGPMVGKDRQAFSFQICNPPEGKDWNVWGAIYNCSPDTDRKTSTALIRGYGGSYFRIFPVRENCDTFTVNYTAYKLEKYSWAPEGFVIDRGDGKASPVELECRFRPGPEYQDLGYDRVDIGITDMIPQPKKVRFKKTGGKTAPGWEASFKYERKGHPAGWYRIEFNNGKVRATVADRDGEIYACSTLRQLADNAGTDAVPDLVIEDWPDLPYRGLMLDVARAFLKKEEIKTLLDAMARYKLNYLQFHLTDDEGWRIEIPGLPELTSYAAFHALPEKCADGQFRNIRALCPSYDGCADPDNADAVTNGYYSREDYIEIIRYAWERGIRVIPEIDTPGHSSASIAAMERHFINTGDRDFKLKEDADRTVTRSVQHFSHNVLNVALPATYNFVEKVVDELCLMYSEAGVPLEEIHMGGDEVPDGSWVNSPACRALNPEWTKSSQFKEYYVNRLLDIFEERGIKIDGWQEIALNLSPATQERLRRNLGFLNAWDTLGEHADIPFTLANSGLTTVVCNVEKTYLDLAYNGSKSERGLVWGGYVNEFTTFSLIPYRNRGSIKLSRPECIRGVQGHLWGENIKGFETAGYMIFPKALGLFERGWNAHPSWENSPELELEVPEIRRDFDRFCTIICEREFPYYERVGISYRGRIGY